ncbi:PREDICTED: zinc finger protein ZAT9-like [Tarenaya hassleriana]|uniref:zinc finger protein ZAT9-like n=1 Tax=Tarenaya hassleriana TaxID=28532 RepID=UPI00053CA585|nr:PREDICTED: zinc finger protein ZAT9-like [Tarenaya hassleriana]
MKEEEIAETGQGSHVTLVRLLEMERYKSRLRFNGRALGGHVRSHVFGLSAKRERCGVEEDDGEEEEKRPSPLGDETESGELLPSSSAFSSSSSSDEEEEDDVAVVDDHGSIASVLLQTGESETDSSRIKLTRRRSKRNQKLGELDADKAKKLKTSQLGFRSTVPVPEPLSSASDTASTEEDLAFCLVMLSRDKWKKESKPKEVQEDDQDDDNDNGEEEDRTSKNRARGEYKCETCGRVFKSYQALGGHRASHKKNRVCRTDQHQWRGTGYEVGNAVAEKKIHECTICLRRFIDLNLPAPTEDDDTSQAEASVVFDEC